MDKLMKDALAAKLNRRKNLARLPIAEKVRILVEMQKMAAPLLKAQGRRTLVWRLSAQNKKGLR